MRIGGLMADHFRNFPCRISISKKTYEGLIRRKGGPFDELNNVIERLLLNSNISLSIEYTQSMEYDKWWHSFYTVYTSKEIRAQLRDLKKNHKLGTYDETIWRVMYNGHNRKI